MLPLRPLGAGDVLDGTVMILRRAFRTLAAIVLLVHAPYQLLTALALDRLLPELDEPGAMEPLFTGAVPVDLLTRLVTVGGIVAIVALLVHVLVGGAIAAAIGDLDRGEPSEAGRALRAGAAVSGATLGASVLLLVAAVSGGLLLAVVVGALAVASVPLAVAVGVLVAPVYVGAGLALGYLVLPIAVAERTGPVRTLVRAGWVLRRRFWWVVGVTLLVTLLVAAVTFVLQLLVGVAALFAGPGAFAVEAVGGTLSALVSVPLTLGAAALIHHDARVRGEGHDLRLRVQHDPWA